MSQRNGRTQGVAIAGAATLLGKELKQVLEDRNLLSISAVGSEFLINTTTGGNQVTYQEVTGTQNGDGTVLTSSSIGQFANLPANDPQVQLDEINPTQFGGSGHRALECVAVQIGHAG